MQVQFKIQLMKSLPETVYEAQQTDNIQKRAQRKAWTMEMLTERLRANSGGRIQASEARINELTMKRMFLYARAVHSNPLDPIP